jgi:hypothetical protein
MPNHGVTSSSECFDKMRTDEAIGPGNKNVFAAKKHEGVTGVQELQELQNPVG